MTWQGVWQGDWEGGEGEPGNPVVYAGLVVQGVGAATMAGELLAPTGGFVIDLLFAHQWRASQRRQRERAQAHREASKPIHVEPTRIEVEPFPKAKEATAEELAGYSAMAAALVRAEVRQKVLAQQAMEAAAHEQMLIALAVMQQARNREEEEIAVLLLLS